MENIDQVVWLNLYRAYTMNCNEKQINKLN